MTVERLAAAVTLALSFAGAQGALYKWVDDQGRVQYSDRPPAKDQGAVQLSNRGIVVKRIEGGLTPEQKQAKEEEEARKKAEEAKAAEQRRLDSALLASFTNAQEIDRKRDREIQAIEAVIATLRGQERTVNARLADDRRRAESFARGKKPVPDAVKQDVARGEGESKLLGEEIKRKADEVAATRARYEELKKRYVELRQSPSPPGASTAPAPAKK